MVVVVEIGLRGILRVGEGLEEMGYSLGSVVEAVFEDIAMYPISNQRIRHRILCGEADERREVWNCLLRERHLVTETLVRGVEIGFCGKLGFNRRVPCSDPCEAGYHSQPLEL